MQSVPYGSNISFQGVITILLNENAIRHLLERIDIGQTGLIYISDSNGNIMTYRLGNECNIQLSDIRGSAVQEQFLQNLSTKDYILSSTASAFNKWTFVSVVPAKVVMLKVDYIRRITAALMIATLLCGIALTLLLTYRKAKTLENIVDVVGDFLGTEVDKNKNEYFYLENAVSRLISNNISLQNKMKEQEPLLEAALLRRLLYGEYYGPAVEKTLRSYSHFDLQDKLVTVIILRIEGQDPSTGSQMPLGYDIIRILVKECIKQQMNQKYYLLDLDEKSIAVLAAFDHNDPGMGRTEINSMSERLYLEMREKCSTLLFFALGNFHRGLSGVHEAFMEASHVLDYKKFERKSKIIWYENIPVESDVYHYPIDLELQLISLVKSGDMEKVKTALREIYCENFEKRQLSKNMTEQLIFAMKGTIIRGLGRMAFDINVKTVIDELDKAGTIDEIFNYVVRANLEICRIMNEQKKANQEDLIHEIHEYVKSNYHQSDLTLYHLAVDFGMTESYAYQFFKDKMGATFADYLENLRIQEACRFLKEGNIPVKFVANQVGYNSDNSFRRAFKRVMGITPSEYGGMVK
jgi:AraC-like DNA-binding protein